MSQQLLWECVKNQNAFLVRSNGITLSKDPFNPTGRQTYGNAGFIQQDGFGIQASRTPYQNNFEVLERKKVKYQRRSTRPSKANPLRKTRKDKVVDQSVAETGRNSIYSVGLSVRHGVHTLRKVEAPKIHIGQVITKRYGSRRLGFQRSALRKAALLNAATARHHRNQASAAAAAVQKKDKKAKK